jgi:hypothetical protein
VAAVLENAQPEEPAYLFLAMSGKRLGQLGSRMKTRSGHVRILTLNAQGISPTNFLAT